MISTKIYRSVALGTLIASSLLTNIASPAHAGVDLSEDKLNTEKSLKWGGEGLPFNDVVTLRDSLVNSIVGKVVIDRHGEDNGVEESTGLLSGLFNAMNIKAPFAGPRPGRMTIVTLWGAKEEGCFVKALVHNAPKSNTNLNELVPTKMEIGLGNQVVKLSPAAKSSAQGASGSYSYTDNDVQRTGTQYFTTNTFAVNARVADLFRNAPVGDAKVRITFANGNSQIFSIGRKNVAQWRDSYSYNSSCQARG
jgi:hypothetical protein